MFSPKVYPGPEYFTRSLVVTFCMSAPDQGMSHQLTSTFRIAMLQLSLHTMKYQTLSPNLGASYDEEKFCELSCGVCQRANQFPSANRSKLSDCVTYHLVIAHPW